MKGGMPNVPSQMPPIQVETNLERSMALGLRVAFAAQVNASVK